MADATKKLQSVTVVLASKTPEHAADVLKGELIRPKGKSRLLELVLSKFLEENPDASIAYFSAGDCRIIRAVKSHK